MLVKGKTLKEAKSNTVTVNNDFVDLTKEHLDILNQYPVVMIARIFNMLPVLVKMLNDGKQCKVREIVYKNQFYDTNKFFMCKFDL
jgi:phenolic acid decarboxylase